MITFGLLNFRFEAVILVKISLLRHFKLRVFVAFLLLYYSFCLLLGWLVTCDIFIHSSCDEDWSARYFLGQTHSYSVIALKKIRISLCGNTAFTLKYKTVGSDVYVNHAHFLSPFTYAGHKRY